MRDIGATTMSNSTHRLLPLTKPALEQPNSTSCSAPASALANRAAPANKTVSAKTNLIGVTALRGWAAVAVVVLHACMPYSTPAMPGLVWSVTDTPSQTATVLMWSIEVVIMPVFLVVAGFLASQSMANRGPSKTLKNRLKRLGWPLLWTTLFLIPVDLYIWLCGLLADGVITPRKLQSLKFDDALDSKIWGLSHLWFLQYLMTYVALLALGWDRLQSIGTTSLRRWGLPACLGIAVAVLAARPEVVWGFQHAFLPVASKWIYSGVFFLAGAMWWRLDPQLQALTEHSKRLIGPSVMLWTAAVTVGIWWLTQAPNATASMVNQTSLAILTVAAAACVTFALVGLSMRKVNRLGPITGRLASASFLIYLLHHPVVGLAHISAKYAATDFPVWIKVVGVTLIGVGAGIVVDFLGQCRRERSASGTNETSQDTLPFESAARMVPESTESRTRAA
ncbi:Peptidoglycan/LPS O-acetylase OafA/YrhL, contains acyltransferase and SGNH-hydrolase domains [Neorhodopirellula lusitana]|uniref:Peptidoglycan/LPS O-acetylase OafA/YrhL, contains acyltransferase and SGNH-hydrolase domains n=2 Tax=Neorhodopirellula lusitana TaxID=445327 RepID=A0ABY1PRQ2_9BACT|nr:Peptidoglycan/LPS O-acetylase OafA/YrhL, contains acyltransferase and SGNH-hydrolase domains [Neorhodopirellula lusitana]